MARHDGRDLWLDAVQRDLAAVGVPPVCVAMVSSMLTFKDEDRLSAVELLNSDWLRSEPPTESLLNF